MPISIALFGAILTLVQFFQNRSLWLDEAMLALNIIRKSPLSLFKPLDDEQVAPILFLQIEKLFSHVMSYSEYGLRLFPLICYVFSAFFLYKILKGISKELFFVAFGLLFFSLNANLIYYASEVKQYMTDVMIGVWIPYLILKEYPSQQRRILWLGMAGAISLFLSSITPIILFCAAMYLIFSGWKNRIFTFIPLLKIFGLWFVFFLVYYFSFVHKHPTRDAMIHFWTHFGGGFPPMNKGYFNFVFSKIYYHFTIYGKAGIFLFLMFITGIFSLLKKKKYNYILLFLLPLVLHILLSTFRMYPLNGRLMMYLLPGFLIVACFGIQFLMDLLPSRFNFQWPLLTLLILILSFQTSKIFPVRSFYQLFPANHADELKQERVREALKYVLKTKKDNDIIYVGSGVGMAFEYYRLKDHLKLENHIVKGDWFHINDVLENNMKLVSGDILFLASGLYPIGEEAKISEFLTRHHYQFSIQKDVYPQVSIFKIKSER